MYVFVFNIDCKSDMLPINFDGSVFFGIKMLFLFEVFLICKLMGLFFVCIHQCSLVKPIWDIKFQNLAFNLVLQIQNFLG